MSWLAAHDDSAITSGFERVLGLRPDLLERYRAFYGALWDEAVLPTRLLELGRLRIAGLNRCEAESAIAHADSGVTAAERASLGCRELPNSVTDLERRVLEVASKVPFEIHGVEDDEIAMLRDALGDDGLVALMVALPLFDMSCRLRLVLEVEPEAREVERPASRAGTLY
jgi:alkylhydroperoxidase family enzyme